jgi:hypothetical protein
MDSHDVILTCSTLLTTLAKQPAPEGFFYYYYYYWWGGTKSLGTAATSGLLYKPQMIDEDDFWSNWWNED